jgi:Xaa-Pro aminopeptidase
MTQDERKGMTPGKFDPAKLGEKQLAFPREEYEQRQKKLKKLLQRERVDLLWMTTPEAVAWTHGYVVSWYKANSPMRYPQLYGTALPANADGLVHFDNPSEAVILARNSVSPDNKFFSSREPDEVLPFIVAELKAKGWLKPGTRIGMEFWSYLPNRAISEMLEAAFRAAGAEIVDASALVREARRVKSEAELQKIREAMRICDIGHATVTQEMRPGMTELELFGLATAAMMKAGGGVPALIPIFNASPVIDGEPQMLGHAMAGRHVLKEGEILEADLCGVVDRYHGNLLRGHYLGAPPKKLEEKYRLAAGAFDVIRSECRAGQTQREVSAILRRYYEDCGLWDTPGWALGYELGLSLPPDWVGDFYFNLRDTKPEYVERVFEPGMVTNFESLYGTALIDTMIWHEKGVEILGKTPLALLSVPA